jgi:hypothetical protein
MFEGTAETPTSPLVISGTSAIAERPATGNIRNLKDASNSKNVCNSLHANNSCDTSNNSNASNKQ